MGEKSQGQKFQEEPGKWARNRKGRKYIRYLFSGGLTTLISVAGYYVFTHLMDYRVANALSLFVATGFAFVVNKVYVFERGWGNARGTLREVCRFLLARFGSFAVDYVFLILCVEVFGFDKVISKVVIVAVVIVVNYLISDCWVFRKDVGERDGFLIGNED